MRSFTLLTAFLLSLGVAMAVPPQAGSQPVEFYRFSLGDFEITVLLDRVGERDPESIALQPERVKEAMEAQCIHGKTTSCVSGFLIHTGKNLVLVDTGMRNELVNNLKASGYQPEQVDTVLLTHLHPDHCMGVSQDSQLTFPNAVVRCDQRESAYWLDQSNATSALKGRFDTIQDALGPVQEAGKLKPFDGALEIVPGIRSVPSYGHTPGHTAYLVENGGQGLLLWGDTVHLAEAQFPHPELTVKYDSDSAGAAASRRRLLQMADSKGYVIGSPHISFPGLGRVRPEGDGYRWLPLPYGTQF